MVFALLFALVAAALFPPAVLAQSVNGGLQGRVIDSNGMPVEGVRVTVAGRNLPGMLSRPSDARGYFRFPAVAPGRVGVRFARLGWRPVVIDSIAIEIGRVTTLAPVALSPAPTALSEVTITAPAEMLDPANTDVGATITTAEYDALPGDPDFLSLLPILPHANESHRGDPVNVAGATGLENMYFVDGVNVTAPLHAQEGMRLPYHFVQAVEVKAGGYEAQYGKALGAVVNAVTYSGTNNFELRLFGAGTHSSLAGESKAEPSLEETSALAYDAGFRAGGPIVRDAVWFSAAYNPRVRRAVRKVGTLGEFDDETRSDVYAAKITWRIGAALTELSLFGDPTTRSAVTIPPGIVSGLTPLNPDPFLSRVRTGGKVVSLRTTIQRGAIVGEANISYARNHDSSGPLTRIGRDEPRFLDRLTGTISGGTEFFDTSTGERKAAMLRLLGSSLGHDLIAGASIEDASTTRTAGIGGGRAIERDFAGSFSAYSEESSGDFRHRILTGYLQDSWHPTDRVSINPGIRLSSQSIYGASGNLAVRFRNEWQPRLGIVVTAREGRQRLFGSVGRFYQDVPLNLASLLYVDGLATQATFDGDPRVSGSTQISSFSFPRHEEDFTKITSVRRAEYSDEATLGYEIQVGRSSLVRARAIRRELRSSFQWGFGDSGVVIGTPGEADFEFLPHPKREYSALELSAEGFVERIRYRASYVLSRSSGNYTGYYEPDFGYGNPGGNAGFLAPHQALNSDGLLPNDRTHVLKLSGWRRIGGPVTLGGILTVESGSPVNEFAPGPIIPIQAAFVVPRGSAGRTPALWDLNSRLTIDLSRSPARPGRFLIDVLHIGNPQHAVKVDEFKYLANSGGTFSQPNPGYRRHIAFQPPMMARLGLELDF